MFGSFKRHKLTNMIKATVLYGHPQNAETFESYYSENHVPLVGKTPGVIKAEFTKFLPAADGAPAAYYRMAELYFEGAAEMQASLSSPQGKTLVNDLTNFATGGATVLFGTINT